MADDYLRYGVDPRLHPAPQPPLASVKRPRPDFGAGPELQGYYSHGEDRGGRIPLSGIQAIGASYDPYRNGISSYGAAGDVRPVGVGGYLGDHLGMHGARLNGPKMGYEGGRIDVPLPSDASCTLYVEGLPADVSRREVSHIFRPFVGFREVRLVKKDSKLPGGRGDPLLLCFVDFMTPNQAAIALEALQGYNFDESDYESSNLKMQFARYAGPRSGAGPRGRR